MENLAVVNAEAAEWWSRMRLAEPPADTRAAFERWRAADPAHAEAFERTDRLWRDLGRIGELPQGESLLQETARITEAPAIVSAAPHRSRTRRYLPIAIAASVLALALIPLARWLMPGEVYTTQTAEVRELTLPDGSHVTLGARSRIELVFTGSERRVRLTGGEAFFDIGRNAAKPFVVEAGNALVRVLGTRFNVRRGAQETNIAVLDGVVEILQGDRPAQRLTAHQRVTLGSAQSPAAESIQRTASAGDWRSGRLSYDGTPLIEVVADVNRYYPAGISLASENLADLKVTTAFEVRQIDLMIDSLTVALPLVAERRADGHVVLTPKQ